MDQSHNHVISRTIITHFTMNSPLFLPLGLLMLHLFMGQVRKPLQQQIETSSTPQHKRQAYR